MVKPRDIATSSPDDPCLASDGQVIFCELPSDFPVSDAELTAIERLLGDDLRAFLEYGPSPRQS